MSSEAAIRRSPPASASWGVPVRSPSEGQHDLRQADPHLDSPPETTETIAPRLPWFQPQPVDTLSKHAAFIERVANASPIIIYVFDLALNQHVYCNQALTAILGYTPDDLQRFDSWLIRNLIHPDDRAMMLALRPRIAAASDHDVMEYEYRLRDAHGEWRWLAARETVFLRDRAGAPRQVLGNAMDITDRKLAEIALRDGQRRYELATSAGRIAVWDCDVDNKRVSVKPPFPELLGYAPGDYDDRVAWTVYVHPDDRQHIRAAAETRFAPDAPRDADGNTPLPEIEYRAISRDGVVQWLADRGTVLRRPDGTAYRAVGTITDITDRKLAEMALRESTERFLLASGAGRVAVWEMDIATGRVHTSPPFPELLGFAPSEYEDGHDCRRYIHSEDQERVLDSDLPELHPDAPRDDDGNTPLPEIEYRALGRDGAARWLIDRGAVLRRPDGEPHRVVGTTTDITIRKRVEEELRTVTGGILRAQEEERRRIASDLHDGVSQDLAAMGINLLRIEQTAPDLPDEAHAVLTATQELGERVLRELRTLSYLLHPPLLEQGGLSDALRDYALGFAKRTGITVDIEDIVPVAGVPEDAEVALYRVAQECLVNIQRHSGSGFAAVRLSAAPHGVVLQISDRGRGMNSRAGADGPGQIGVGIASMRERVRHLGGRLDIRSGATGTTVTARLPLPAGGEQREP